MQLFQFLHDEAERGNLDPDFTLLDNKSSTRPDLFEYESIRYALMNFKFKENEYVGFFHPCFLEMTSMTGQQVKDRVSRFNGEIISFSPAFEDIACYPNSFVQGEAVHSGFLSLAQSTVRALGMDIDLSKLMQDQTRVIFRNCFVAKYEFWLQWLDLTEQLIELTEIEGSVLSERLNAKIIFREGVFYSAAFLMLERMISLLLEMKGVDAAIGVDFGHAPFTSHGVKGFFSALMRLDAMKGQFIKTRSPMYLDVYNSQRERFFRTIAAASSMNRVVTIPNRSGSRTLHNPP